MPRKNSVLGSLAALVAALWAVDAPAQIVTFSDGPDEALTYPSSLTATLPDEHTTFIPPAPGSQTYLVFAADFSAPIGAPVVLETADLKTFSLAAGYSQPVMSPPINFRTCKPSYDPEFDLNYAAPGSVLQDPTRPPGNLIMIFEAENHCPGGVWQQPFYVTVGATRSSDNGKTWPPLVDAELGGLDRYPILKVPVPEPTTPEQPPVALGDGLPSAFVDGTSLYVAYFLAGPGNDGLIRVARAPLGGAGQLSFSKWHTGAFSEPGIGGLDSAVLPSRGCTGFQIHPQISYNDAIGLYVMTFVCASSSQAQAAWYFSTATSLDLQNWTAPQMIANSQSPYVAPCPGTSSGAAIDGWYPSFMSPGSATGHTSLTGYVFFLDGCDTGARTFRRRTFTITGSPPPLSLAASVNQPTLAAGQQLIAGGAVTNAGRAGAADFYVGILRPDNTIQFFTSSGIAVGRLADLSSFRPIATGVPLAGPFSVSVPSFYATPWTGSEQHGSYTFFLAAVTAGALTDGVVTSNEILGLATASYSFP